MGERPALSGKFVWFELASTDPRRAQSFFKDLLAWRTVSFPIGGAAYEMIWAGDTPETMVGGYLPGLGAIPHARWIPSVSVDDVDRAAAEAVARGGRALEPPHDLPGVGRAARILDPQGAEVGLFRSAAGDPPDLDAPPGRFIWSELHTTAPESAVAFYASVVGYAHRSVPSPAGAYHILSSAGCDRGGMTGHLFAGTAPHWLPYVRVEDVDRTLDRAQDLGGRVVLPAEDIPDVGRVGALSDPTGAVLAVMRPNPRGVTS